ncbi:MAG: hypothetical protein ACRDPY_47175, partial [Streptosporangiaceae bacterium]
MTGLRAQRIGRRLNCLADPALVACLRESQVPLEVCPTPNVCTRQEPDLVAGPLPRLLAEDLFVTLASDDPLMFGTTLTRGYGQAAAVLGLSRGQLAGLARNGVRASFLDRVAKQALIDGGHRGGRAPIRGGASVRGNARLRVGQRFRGDVRVHGGVHPAGWASDRAGSVLVVGDTVQVALGELEHVGGAQGGDGQAEQQVGQAAGGVPVDGDGGEPGHAHPDQGPPAQAED